MKKQKEKYLPIIELLERLFSDCNRNRRLPAMKTLSLTARFSKGTVSFKSKPDKYIAKAIMIHFLLMDIADKDSEVLQPIANEIGLNMQECKNYLSGLSNMYAMLANSDHEASNCGAVVLRN